MKIENILRAAAIGCIMIAGSCAVSNDETSITSDPRVNNPIMVEPSFREIKLQFAGGVDGLEADEALKFEAFLDEYRALGAQVVDDELVMHHFVAHIDRRAEALQCLLDDLDGALDAGAEAARIGEQDFHGGHSMTAAR